MGRETWDRSRVEAIVATFPAHGWDLDRAAAAHGLSRNTLESALRRVLGRSFGDMQRAAASGAAVVVQAPVLPPPQRSEPPVDVPAWQGYAPRQTWKAPDPVRPARATAPEVKRVAVVADVHVPFQDRVAFSTVLGLLRDWKPHRVVLLGDFMDLESLSRHPKNRPDLVRLAEEYYEANVALDALQDAAPDATWLALEGNHEGRASRYCAEFGSLDGMLSVPQSLYIEPRGEYHRERVELRGMVWVPLRKQPFVIEGAGFLHGVFENMHHAASHAEKLGPSIGVRHLFAGHTHDFQSYTSAAGFSCHHVAGLGDWEASAFGYTKGRPRGWGKGIQFIEQAGDLLTTTPVPIVGGRALVAGRLVAAA